ncbi:MAG: PucR family transcriptional regulator ligand-binding domain-containing protein, partial [Nocardioidaceae bacterium]
MAGVRSRHTPLTVERLVAEPGLGLSVVEKGDLSRTVTGAHAIEIAHPARWLQPGVVMLTTGLRLVDGDESECHSLVDELADQGVAALLFGVGVHVDEVPTALAAAARRRAFTLVAVAAETPFQVVEDFVNRTVVSSETEALKRSLRLHEDLLRTLAYDEPVTALISRLAILARGAAALYDKAGEAIAATGEAPLRLIWNEINTQEDRPQTFTVGRWTVSAISFSIGGSAMHAVVASRSPRTIEEIGPQLLETTVHILGAANGIRSVTLTHVRAESRRLLAALQSGLPGSRVRQTWDRLRTFHLRPAGTMRYLVASPLPGGTALGARRPTDELLELAHDHSLGLLLHEDDTGAADTPVVAVVADTEDTGDWLAMFARSHLVGLSSGFTDLTTIPEHVSEAHSAWRLLGNRRAAGSDVTVLAMDDVDLATWVMATRDDRDVHEMVRRQVGVLEDAPDLRATVIAYLAYDQDLRRTAERLYVHVNTVRYRLAKVEKLLGTPIARASTVANLYLALQD